MRTKIVICNLLNYPLLIYDFILKLAIAVTLPACTGGIIEYVLQLWWGVATANRWSSLIGITGALVAIALVMWLTYRFYTVYYASDSVQMQIFDTVDNHQFQLTSILLDIKTQATEADLKIYEYTIPPGEITPLIVFTQWLEPDLQNDLVCVINCAAKFSSAKLESLGPFVRSGKLAPLNSSTMPRRHLFVDSDQVHCLDLLRGLSVKELMRLEQEFWKIYCEQARDEVYLNGKPLLYDTLTALASAQKDICVYRCYDYDCFHKRQQAIQQLIHMDFES